MSFNVPNAIEVKKYFMDNFLATSTKYFSLPLSFDPNHPERNTATIAALVAYASYIRVPEPELATKIDLLVEDMQRQ